jgi:hypothetical protein
MKLCKTGLSLIKLDESWFNLLENLDVEEDEQREWNESEHEESGPAVVTGINRIHSELGQLNRRFQKTRIF